MAEIDPDFDNDFGDINSGRMKQAEPQIDANLDQMEDEMAQNQEMNKSKKRRKKKRQPVADDEALEGGPAAEGAALGKQSSVEELPPIMGDQN